MRTAVASCLLAMVVGLAASVVILAERVRIERAHRSVELVVDYDEVADLAGATGRTVGAVLEALRAAGVTGVGISEDTLPSLVSRGRATVAEPSAGVDAGDRVVLRLANPADRDRVVRCLRAKWSLVEPSSGSDPTLICVPGSLERLEDVGVGWDRARSETVVAAGLTPIARPFDSPVISSVGIAQTFDEIRGEGMVSVLFRGKFVLGNADLIGETAAQIARGEMRYYAIELDVQEGTDTLSRFLGGRVIRTHSIGETELKRYSPASAAVRFGRGVRERGIRCCFVRLFLDRASPDPVAYNAHYVGLVRKEVEASGCTTGAAGLPTDFNRAHRLDPLIGVGVAGGVALLLLVLLGPGLPWAICAGAVLLGCGLLAIPTLPGRHGYALLGAIALPSVGALAVRFDRPGGTMWRPLAGLAVAAGASVAGGLLVAGLLSETLTMEKVDQFRGVKLALAGPVLLVLAVYGLRLLPDGRRVRERLGDAASRLGKVAATPVSVGVLIVLLAHVGALVYWIARSGNAAASTQTGAERLLREQLELLLVYRPRTKEFLIGHPSLVLGLWLASRGCTRWAPAVAAMGAIGLTSIVNTFCHIHTPLMATVLRTIYGVALGGFLGLLCCAAASWVAKRKAPPAAGNG